MSRACILIIFAVALLGCAIGLRKYIWLLTVGYGLAMSCCAATLFVMGLTTKTATAPFLIMCGVIFAYGLRLGLFLLLREMKNADYRKTLASAGGEKKMPAPVLITMWIMVAALYMMMVSPLYYRIQNIANRVTTGENGFMWAGVVISALGVVIESLADAQKTAQKKENPKMVATKGLYKFCRCPNYFGEMLVWTGVLVSGLPVLRGGWQWIAALAGYACIVYIMFDGAKRLEIRQTKRCWKMPEYVKYADHTPIIIPFVPIYHLIDWRR